MRRWHPQARSGGIGGTGRHLPLKCGAPWCPRVPRFTKLGPSRLGLAVTRACGEAEGVGLHPQVKRQSGLWHWRPPSRVLACRGPAALLAGPRSQSRGPVSLECLVWDGGLAAPLFDRHSWAVISTGACTCGVGERPGLRVRPCVPGRRRVRATGPPAALAT